jgi:hypothetical protein
MNNFIKYIMILCVSIAFAGLPESEVVKQQITSYQTQFDMQNAWTSQVNLYGDIYTRKDSIYTRNEAYWQGVVGLDWNLGNNSDRKVETSIKKIKLLQEKQKLDSLESLEVLKKWQMIRRVHHFEQFIKASDEISCSDSLLKSKRFDLIESQSACYRIERYRIQSNLVLWHARDTLSLLKDVELKLDTLSDIIDVSNLYVDRYSDALLKEIVRGSDKINDFKYDFGIRVGENLNKYNTLQNGAFIGAYFSIPINRIFGVSYKDVEYDYYFKSQEMRLSHQQSSRASYSKNTEDLNKLRSQLVSLGAQIELQKTLVLAIKFRIKNALEGDYDKLLRATVDLAVLQFQMASMLDDQAIIVQTIMYAQGVRK